MSAAGHEDDDASNTAYTTKTHTTRGRDGESRRRTRNRMVGLIAVVLVLASAPGCRRTPDNSQDRADVQQVFAKYLQSIDAGDVALASQVWLQSPDVLVVTPVGRFYDFVFTAKRADGQPFTSKGWESHGYQRTANGWRIAHLHYSVPPPRSRKND
jgi:hypothetical protein